MPSRRPSQAERDAFLLKVIDFRRSLSPREQRMLDAIAVVAFCEDPLTVPPTRERWRPHADSSPWMRVLDAE